MPSEAFPNFEFPTLAKPLVHNLEFYLKTQRSPQSLSNFGGKFQGQSSSSREN